MQEPLQKNNSEDKKKYFKNLLPNGKVYFQGNREVSPGLQIVDMSTIPYNALSLYITGFAYLALEKEAADFFKIFSEVTLLELIERKKKQYRDDVPILQEALRLKQEKDISNEKNPVNGKLSKKI